MHSLHANHTYLFYSKLRMVDRHEFQELEKSMELSAFLNSCMRQIESAKDQLSKKYFYDAFS